MSYPGEREGKALARPAPARYMVTFWSGDVWECEFVDGILRHVLASNHQVVFGDSSIRELKLL